jgi:acyl-CoA thioester hydrolase
MKKKDFNFIYPIRVRYAEVDAQGIVFNAHYLTYFDCTITEYYRKLKYNYAIEVKKNKKDFHVIRTIIDYKKPLVFDQLIEACLRTSNIGFSSITYDIGLFEKNRNKMLALGTIIQVYTDQIKMKPAKLPNNFIKKIKRFENI